MLQELDLRVFEGEFSCCSLEHKNMSKCDKEALRKPLLGIYYNSLVRAHVTLETSEEEERTHLGPEHFHGNLERMFPPQFIFTKKYPNGKTMHEERELFGPLVEMMAKRVEARDKGTDSVEILQVLHRPKHGG